MGRETLSFSAAANGIMGNEAAAGTDDEESPSRHANEEPFPAEEPQENQALPGHTA
jgi:hypothetical protein